jgi:ribosomal protein L37AE/L43A
MKNLPVLEQCFKCGNKVFEFEENLWGCDTCKRVWSFKGKTWVEVNSKRVMKQQQLINIENERRRI